MTPGIYPHTREQYDGVKGRINFSTLKHFAKSPRHYQVALAAAVPDDRDVLVRGRAVHSAILEPETFKAQYVVWDGRRAGKEWESFKLENEHAGRDILTDKMAYDVHMMSTAVRESRMARQYLEGSGLNELSVLWTHVEPELGALPGYSFDCKARIDRLKDAFAIDLKSTRDASPAKFGAQMYSLEGHAQAAWYVDAVKAATGRTVDYVWIAVEATAPWIVQCYVARQGDQVLEQGRERYRDFLAHLNVCRKTNEWPGYAAAPMELVVPRWAQSEDDEEDLSELGLTNGRGP